LGEYQHVRDAESWAAGEGQEIVSQYQIPKEALRDWSTEDNCVAGTPIGFEKDLRKSLNAAMDASTKKWDKGTRPPHSIYPNGDLKDDQEVMNWIKNHPLWKVPTGGAPSPSPTPSDPCQ